MMIRKGLLALFVLGSFTSFAQKDKKLVEETVTKESIQAKIEFLASDEMRGRNTPSPELDLAARYLASHLKENGVKIIPGMDSYYQPVPMVESFPPSEGGLTVGDSLYSFDKALLMMSGESADLEGEIIYLNYGSEADFAGADVDGKIVVVRTGSSAKSTAYEAFEEGRKKKDRAMKAGAISLVELYGSPQPTWKILRYYMGTAKVGLAEEKPEETSIPHVWLDDASGESRSFFEEYEGSGSLSVKGAREDYFTTYNVIGVVEGTDKELKDEYVIFSAHYDHVGVGELNAEGDSIFNGTRDNAVGTVTVMEAVKNIGKYPLKRSVVFIFFTGEEKGLLGSEWYVNNPIIPLKETKLCYNADNGGYNDTTFAMIVGLERVTSADDMVSACEAFGLEGKPDQVLDQNLYMRSDHYSFADKGVPGVMFGMAATAFDEGIFK